ncbi:hypothetical protein [Pigmentiphaga litoralis]|uniref:hypothetical protein n=1 Tax=Pigmentiphaga litoralis TaxID=516702 RepID=UPI003B4399B1
MTGKKLIRNSTADFLIFTGQTGEQSIEARYEDETVWLSQKWMVELFLNRQRMESSSFLGEASFERLLSTNHVPR